MKILIIDDDELIRITVRKTLEKIGAVTFEAGEGNEGLALYKKERPDLVITDILMPDKEGLETISDIRALDPKAKIIAMSGGGSMQNMGFLDMAKRLGAFRTLGKPIKPNELISAVQAVLKL